jgi:four helix bundle protein
MMEHSRPYEKLKFYQDICEIRKQVFRITGLLKNDHLRLVSQMRDAARSAKQNIREGYAKGSLAEFIRGIRISQGSLDELCGDMEDCKNDCLISEIDYSHFLTLYKSAMYLSNRCLSSLCRMSPEQWTMPGK